MNHQLTPQQQPGYYGPTGPWPAHRFGNIKTGTIIGMGALLLLTLLVVWRVQPAPLLDDGHWIMLHPLLELFSVMVSLLIFSAGWHFQARRKDQPLLLVSTVFLITGLLDFAHTVTYAGFPELLHTNSQQTLFFSLVVRGLVAVGLLAAVLRWPKRLNRPIRPAGRLFYLSGALGLTAFVSWLVLFFPGIIPDVHFSGHGPTPFYLVSVTLILALYVLTGGILWARRQDEYPFSVNDLFISINLLFISEIFFIRYLLFTDFFNLGAHIVKVIAYGYLYRAIFVENVQAALRRLYRTERRLEMNRKWLYTTLHSIGDAVIATDAVGRVQFMNPVAEQLTGWSASEAQGKPIDDVFRIINEQTRQPVESPVAQVLRDGTVAGLANHTLLLAKDGRGIPIDDSAAPIRTETGIIQGAVLVFRDVSERKQREKEQQRLLAILEETTDFVSTADARGRTLYFNRAARQLLGIREDNATERTISDVHPPDVARKVLDEILPVAARHGIWSGETAWLGHDGRQIPTHQVIIAHKGADGQVEYYSTIARDLTALKQSQEKERLAAKILESISEGIIVTDPNDIIVTTNPAFTAITGYTEAEAVGKRPSQLLAPDADPAELENMWAILRKTGQWRGEKTSRRKNGQLYYEELSISAVRDETGTVTHYVGVLKDITKRKKLESQIQYIAFHDPLTGLPNRMFFLHRLKQAIATAKRTGQQLAVLFLDMDRFKQINDTLGHAAGDSLLKQVALRLSQCVRETDTVSRLGGDEFVALLCPTDGRSGAAKVAEKMLAAFAKPFVLEGQEYTLSPSIGISVYPDDGDQVNTLLRKADTAMYQAKQIGNHYEFYHAGMDAIAKMEK